MNYIYTHIPNTMYVQKTKTKLYQTFCHFCIPARDTLERLGVSFGSPYKVNEPFDTLVNTA